MLNAFRGQVFSAAWASLGPASEHGGEQQLERLATTQVIDGADWIASPLESLGVSLSEHRGDRLILGGSGLAKYSVGDQVIGDYELASEEVWSPNAKIIGRMGFKKFLADEHVDAFELKPNYVRASAAEEAARKNS